MPPRLISKSLVVLLLCSRAEAGTFDNSYTGDSTDINSEAIVWISGEFGVHSQNLAEHYTKSGGYEKLSFEIPLGTRIGLFLLFDDWRDEATYTSFGLGVHSTFLRVMSHWFAPQRSYLRLNIP